MRQVLRVLVGDPCRDTVESVGLLLRCWGHRVWGAQDGPAVLEVARSCQPDVVLMDIGLPGMDGYEVARRLRQQEGLAQVLLVAVTGYGTEPYRRRSREAGFDCHLLKPVEPEVLQEMLAVRARQILSRRVTRPVPVARRSQSEQLRSFGQPLLTLA